MRHCTNCNADVGEYGIIVNEVGFRTAKCNADVGERDIGVREFRFCTAECLSRHFNMKQLVSLWHNRDRQPAVDRKTS